jgi:hypothetical protein
MTFMLPMIHDLALPILHLGQHDSTGTITLDALLGVQTDFAIRSARYMLRLV